MTAACLFALVFVSNLLFSHSTVYKLGILYEDRQLAELTATKAAVAYANAKIMPALHSLTYTELAINQSDTHDAIRKSCALLKSGIVAQVGPGTSEMVVRVVPQYSSLNVPLVTPTASSIFLERIPFLFHLVPSDRQQGLAISHIIRYFNWTKVNIVTSDDAYGVTGMLSLIKMASYNNWRIVTLQQIESNNNSVAHYQKLLTNIKAGGSRIIAVNCHDLQAVKLFEQAKSLSMVGAGWVWLLTDASTDSVRFLPKPPIPDHLLGLVGTAFHNVKGGLYDDFMRFYMNFTSCSNCSLPVGVSKWVDSVLTIAYGIRNFKSNLIPPNGLSCFQNQKWIHGEQFLATLNEIEQPGISQFLNFSQNYPTSFEYSIQNSQTTGWRKIGSWSPSTSFLRQPNESILFPGNAIAPNDYINTLNGKHLRVVTVKEAPFFSYTGTPKNPTIEIYPGEIEGYGIDLLNKLSEVLNFSYILYEVPDGNWGTKDPTTGQWNGMVKELTYKVADMAAATFTINKPREEDIDFSMPYMDLGLSFIMLKSNNNKANLFEFLKPFSANLWIILLSTIILVAYFISTFEKLSPSGYHGEFVYANHYMERVSELRRLRKSHRRESKRALGLMTFPNAIFFAVATLLQQGYENYPTGLSSRSVTLVWWFAIIILVSTYTAKLGSVIISERLVKEINSVTDLYVQSKVLYGTTANTAIIQFFCDSPVDMYRDMCKKMYMNRLLCSHTDQCISWLNDPAMPFANFGDSPVLESLTGKLPCNIRMVGDLFNKLGYGFGLQKGSPYTESVSIAVLRLREMGFMDGLKKKWFQDKSHCSSTSGTVDAATGQTGVTDIRGVFLIVMSTVMLSPVFLFSEIIAACLKNKRQERECEKDISMKTAGRNIAKRFRRDFLYSMPEVIKYKLKLDQYSRAVREKLWELQATNYRKQRELERIEQFD